MLANNLDSWKGVNILRAPQTIWIEMLEATFPAEIEIVSFQNCLTAG